MLLWQKRKKYFKHNRICFGGNLKLMISGAASLDTKIEAEYRKMGFNLMQGYGLTETSPIISIGTNQNYKTGSVGKCVPSVEAKLASVDKTGVGELIVKGPNIMLGYYENQEATAAAIKDGWFYTGDLARMDEEGYIFICGRKKNVIVLKNGKNIYPEEMENLVNQLPEVEESFIFGKQMSEDENNIKIFVKIVYKEEVIKALYGEKTLEDITKLFSEKIKEINQTMPRYKAIKGIVLTTEPLVRTTTNKIKRQVNLEKVIKEYAICNS